MSYRIPNGLAMVAVRMNEDFLVAMTLPILEEQVPKIVWTSPPRDCYKINVDGTYIFPSKVASLRVVAKGMAIEVYFSIVTKVLDIK